jgi:hypothetical protein
MVYFCRMHVKKLLILFCCVLTCKFVSAQSKTYFSTSGEIIFSFAQITKGGKELESNLRWSPVFNWQGIVNHDLGNHVGIFYGLAIRNVGFIYDIPNTDTLKKFRTYNFGIPIGIKLGNMNGAFIWGGYEFEMPFVYKEKTFVNERKTDVFEVWFSNRYNPFLNALFVGINFKRGFNIKFKYYLDQFFNKEFTETVNGTKIKPFADFNANVFYIAIDWNVFKDVRAYKNTKRRTGNSNSSAYYTP